MLESLAEISHSHPHDEHGDTEPGPCPGCQNFRRCALKLLACRQFEAFVRRDRRWPNASQVPLAATFDAAMRS